MQTTKEYTDQSYNILIPYILKVCESFWETLTKEQESKLYRVLAASKDFDEFSADKKYALKSIFEVSITIDEAFKLFDHEYPWWDSRLRKIFIEMTREANCDKDILHALYMLIDHQIRY